VEFWPQGPDLLLIDLNNEPYLVDFHYLSFVQSGAMPALRGWLTEINISPIRWKVSCTYGGARPKPLPQRCENYGQDHSLRRRVRDLPAFRVQFTRATLQAP
jgi:hypothetical protein